MMFHFSGPKNLNNPGVLTFAKVSVDCGSSQFSIPENKLGLLAQAMGSSEVLMCPERRPGVRCDKPLRVLDRAMVRL